MSDQHVESLAEKETRKADHTAQLLSLLRRMWPPGTTSLLGKVLIGALILAGLLIWVAIAGSHHWTRACLLTALAAASFVLGASIGFVFTTYDEESGTIGKLKDWLLGAIATLTVVKFASLQPLLMDFTLHGSRNEFAVAVGVAVVFLGGGFFFMFLCRELFFNVSLARSRGERNRIETGQAATVTLQLLAAIPSSLVVGTSDADQLLKDRPQEAERLRRLLDSKDVNDFLKQSEKAVRDGAPLPWDVVSKNAFLLYYRTYFALPADKKDAAGDALVWIERARVLDPRHIDLAIKQADMLGVEERYTECVEALERLDGTAECPPFVEQWLGYYYLYVPGRADDALECSQRYLHDFPESKESRRNLACAYAELACTAHEATGCRIEHAPHYHEALEVLKTVVRESREHLKVIQTDWIVCPGGPFRCFAHNAAFRRIVELPPDTLV